jgi:peroxiredoxin
MGIKYLQILFVSLLATISLKAGTPAEAEVVAQEYQQQMGAWQAEVAAAQSMEQMSLALAKKPDVNEYKKRMIKVVGSELNKPWSLKYAGWLLANTPLGNKDIQFIMDYANKFHMDAPDLGTFCYSVALSKQPVLPKKLFIEKALNKIADPKQEGVAAISLAIVLSEMGDSAVNNGRRLSLVKEAIIKSADQRIGGTTVGDIAMEMVHRLKNLSKGSLAPEISGFNSSGAPVKLSQYRGKVVMLVFWSSFDLSVQKTIDLLAFMRNVEKQYVGKNFKLIGINKDQIVNLRELEKEAQTSSLNISDPQQRFFKLYRVENSPQCCVVDQMGRISFTGVVGSFATLTVDALLSPARPVAPAVPAKR